MVVPCDALVCIIPEVEPFIDQLLPGDLCGVSVQMFLQYPAVLPEEVIHPTHIIVRITVDLVVVGVAAKVAAEFFVDAPADRLTAFRANPFFHFLKIGIRR
jgi:hypothetical protein